MADKVHGASQTDVRAQIRHFFRTLCDQEDIPAAGAGALSDDAKDWSRTAEFVRRAVYKVRSSCRHYDDANDLEERTWNLYVPVAYLATNRYEDLATFIANEPTPAWLTQEIQHCRAVALRDKTRHKLVLMQIWPVVPSTVNHNNAVQVTMNDGQQRWMRWQSTHPGNHSVLLMMDLSKGTQEFFDPHGEQDEQVRYAEAFASRGPFFQGGRVLSANRTVFPAGQSLQAWAQNVGNIQGDLCSACCYLVIFVYLRHGIVNLHLCAQLIKQAHAQLSNAHKRRFVRRFVAWCNQVLPQPDGEDLVVPELPGADGRCTVVSKWTGKMCTRKPCDAGGALYCWQHRHLWKNPFAAPPKRMACKKPLRGPPRPAGLAAGHGVWA
jgi:hypothetical protein